MNSHADKASQNRSRAVSEAVRENRRSGVATFQFEDNRTESTALQNLQTVADNSPQVSQLVDMQAMAESSPQTQRIAQLQAIADGRISAQTVQRQSTLDDEESAQRFAEPTMRQSEAPANRTGLPDRLKSGIENLSGVSLNDVSVHYNSSRPSQLQALAYTRGSDIHVGPGQEQHLAHEAWHVVQQKQGRVRPTIQTETEQINDNEGLEREADVMGQKALQQKQGPGFTGITQATPEQSAMQMVWIEHGKGIFIWHALRDGTRWYYNETTDTMHFEIEGKPPRELSPQVLDFYGRFAGTELPYEKWLDLMSSAFEVDAEELEDKDDPVFTDPHFLVGEDDRLKVDTAQKIASALARRGLRVFLGGAGAAPLFTRTRPINDLDMRIDGQPRNAFDGETGVHLLGTINESLGGGGLTLTGAFKKVAATTIRGEVNGVEVSITSEPTTETTLTRGEMVPGIESLGEFAFLLDKGFAAANRPNEKIDSVATDVFDIIMTRRSLPNGGAGILSGLDSQRGSGLAAKLIERLMGLIGKSSSKKVNGRMKRGRDNLIKRLGMRPEELESEVMALIKELSVQKTITVL